MNNKFVGKIGEQCAVNFFKSIGYKIMERNFRCKQGEIDIIVQDDSEIVFVEVKTRTNIIYGRPAESVNGIKKRHIYLASKNYLCRNYLENCCIRFDVVEIFLSKGKCFINHIKNIM